MPSSFSVLQDVLNYHNKQVIIWEWLHKINNLDVMRELHQSTSPYCSKEQN